MCTILVSYDEKNMIAARAISQLSMISGIEIDYNFNERNLMNELDLSIEDVKMGRVATYPNFEEYKKATDKMLGYV